jgi:Ran GTPase-activating protein (RanGAP) involved in mRNA processing and transport
MPLQFLSVTTASLYCVFLCFQYNSFDDLERDFIQMCRNAQKYNEEASLIHEDSIVLETVFANARVRLEQDLEPAEEEEEEEEEEITEENPGWDEKSYLILSALKSVVFL